MKKFLFILLSVVSCLGATPLGVLYESENTNNVVSPATLTQGNLRIDTNLVLNMAGIIANRAIRVMENKQVTTSSLTSTQQDYLATWVGGINKLILGGSEIVSGEGSPTNGTTYVQRILYINSLGTNLNDTFWGNYGPNWYAIASTNGGSITENQLNFSNNTTADSTTNFHGLLLRLDGNTNHFLRGDGSWNSAYVLSPYLISTGQKPILIVDPTVIPGSTNTVNYYDNGFTYNQGTLNVTNIALGPLLGGANATLIGGTDSSVFAGLGGFHRVYVPDLTASKLLRLNSTNGLDIVTIGAGLSFDGTTLSQSGSGTNAIGITGTPVAGQVTFWSGANTITGNNNFTFDGSNLGVSGTITGGGVIVNGPLTINNDTSGNIYSGTYTPTVTPIIYTGVATCNLIGVTQNPCRFVRIGDVMTVSGKIQVNGTGAAVNRIMFTVALPTPTGVSGDDLTGVINVQRASGSVTPFYSGSGITSTPGASATFTFQSNSSLSGLFDFYFTFTYDM